MGFPGVSIQGLVFTNISATPIFAQTSPCIGMVVGYTLKVGLLDTRV